MMNRDGQKLLFQVTCNNQWNNLCYFHLLWKVCHFNYNYENKNLNFFRNCYKGITAWNLKGVIFGQRIIGSISLIRVHSNSVHFPVEPSYFTPVSLTPAQAITLVLNCHLYYNPCSPRIKQKFLVIIIILTFHNCHEPFMNKALLVFPFPSFWTSWISLLVFMYMKWSLPQAGLKKETFIPALRLYKQSFFSHIFCRQLAWVLDHQANKNKFLARQEIYLFRGLDKPWCAL